ncbi:MAG: hypothetical protein IT483_04440 [Gammaproteobacteria bacterium]|nr:hypothetical protein [Gammaproteobacteria bacterium]
MTTLKRKQPIKTRPVAEDDDPPLTAAERRAFARNLEDTADRTRYLLVSATLPGFSLYYMLQDDVWSFDDPSVATLFKRRAAAKAVQALLRPGVHIVPCKVDDKGRLDLSSIAARKIGRTTLALQPAWRSRKTARKAK